MRVSEQGCSFLWEEKEQAKWGTSRVQVGYKYNTSRIQVKSGELRVESGRGK